MLDRGRLRTAFRLFLAAAKAGDLGSQVNVGYCYNTGSGVRRDPVEALYWYRRAYRRGDASAANNIGIIWRDEGRWQRALRWFRRAVDLGDEDANLEIAKYYIRIVHHDARALPYLKRVCKSDWVSEASAEEARRLLKKFQK